MIFRSFVIGVRKCFCVSWMSIGKIITIVLDGLRIFENSFREFE